MAITGFVNSMTTPTKGVDADDEPFYPMTPEEIAHDLYVGGYTDHITGSEENQPWKEANAVKHIKALLRQELQAVKSEMPEKLDVDWNNIGTPEMVASQSEKYGYNQAITEMTEKLDKRMEQYNG